MLGTIFSQWPLRGWTRLDVALGTKKVPIHMFSLFSPLPSLPPTPFPFPPPPFPSFPLISFLVAGFSSVRFPP